MSIIVDCFETVVMLTSRFLPIIGQLCLSNLTMNPSVKFRPETLFVRGRIFARFSSLKSVRVAAFALASNRRFGKSDGSIVSRNCGDKLSAFG